MNDFLRKRKGILLTCLLLFFLSVFLAQKSVMEKTSPKKSSESPKQTVNDPLSIDTMRKKEYPGSNIEIEQTLDPGSNYNQYITSYQSEGLKIYAFLTVPKGEIPKAGWPVIILNHGYIPPSVYKTTERYLDYVAAFAQQGYIVFKPDYRGNGNSEGQPEGAYYSPAYTTDVLNAVSSIKRYKQADSARIGMWGHSLGGNITLRSIVVRPNDIRAAVIWGGVVGTYDDLMNNWQRKVSYRPPPQELALRNRSRTSLLQKYGTPDENPIFWHAIDPNYFLEDVTAPVQLHAGLSDEEVPWQFSKDLSERLKAAGKHVEVYTYEDADHNISPPSFSLAMGRSIIFFDRYVKGGDAK